MIQQARNRERIIRADRAYGAVNDWPETLGEPIKLLAAILRDTPRLDGAACVDEDPELFFPDSRDHERIAQAARICFSCPAQAACHSFASTTREQHGIWGGRPRGMGGTTTHCKRGHEWTPETTTMRKKKDGSTFRECTRCVKARSATKEAAA